MADSSDSTETVRPFDETMAFLKGLESNLNRTKHERINRYLETQKLQLNITGGSDGECSFPPAGEVVVGGGGGGGTRADGGGSRDAEIFSSAES